MEINKKRQFDNFDEFAENYRQKHDQVIKISGADSNYFSEYKISELLKFEETEQSLRILDFGCGDGNSSVFIRKYFPHASIYGIDVSEESINIAKKKNIANSVFKTYNGLNLPFKDEEFDFVFTAMVFHHIDYNLHSVVLKDIYRVLRKGGRFYNFEHNPINPFTRKVVRECEFDKDAVLLSPSYNKKITYESGLKVENLNYIFFLPRHKLLNIFIGLEKMLKWCPIGAQYYIRAIK